MKIFFPVHFLFKWRQNLSARPHTIPQSKQIVLQIYGKCASVNLAYSHLATEVAVVLVVVQQKYNSPHPNLVVHADPDSRHLHHISMNYIYSDHSYTEEQKYISFYNQFWLLATFHSKTLILQLSNQFSKI